MGLRLEKIDVKNLGPLDQFSEEFKSINLIYGRNEQGKTYLVEFILKRLFKNPGNFFLRHDNASGKIWVSGLEKGLTEFSNRSSKRLEDYWEENRPGLPENMARLLFVKGGDLDFETDKRGGVSKAAVKAFLSNEKLLDKVQDRIQKTIRNAVFENGQIFGENRGSIKDRNNMLERLNNLDGLLQRVNREYSGGPIYKLEKKIGQIKTELELLNQAKRFTAWQLSGKVDGLKRNLSQLEEAGLDRLLTEYDLINFLNSEKSTKQKKLEQLRKESSEYNWLESAIQVYQRLVDQGAVQIKNLHLYFGTAGLFAGLLFSGIGAGLSLFVEPLAGAVFYLIGLVLFILGIIFGYLYIRQYRKAKKSFSENLEAERIRKTFEKKFGKKFSDLATLQSELNKLRTAYFNANALEEDLENLHKKILEKESEAAQIFSRLGINPGEFSVWGNKISKLAAMKDSLKKKITDLELETAVLDVSVDEFLREDPGRTFSRQEALELQKELQDTEDVLSKERQTLSLLEREIRATIADNETLEWEGLLENLRNARAETLKEYCQLSAAILAGIIVNKVVDQARTQEDEKIREYLETDLIKQPLKDLTGRYDRLYLEGDKILLADDYDSFDLADLSTGAREQVLLALRLGLATRVMGKDSGFLILDDAFQHSDWQRRENLVKGALKLADNGWQIFYFSMDDHIMQLFDDFSKGMDYKKILLPMS